MISKRIKEIAKYTAGYEKIADVGCDHGYLIIEAFNRFKIKYALAIDNKKGPLEKAKENISEYSFKDSVDFSLSNGLEKLSNVDAIFICGMGGILITNIINNDLDKITNQVLILQPNRSSYELRIYLNNNNFEIIKEDIIFDDFYYDLIICKKSNKQNYTKEELLFGPINLLNKTPNFINKLKEELERLNEIRHLSNDNLEKIKMIRRILNDC